MFVQTKIFRKHVCWSWSDPLTAAILIWPEALFSKLAHSALSLTQRPKILFGKLAELKWQAVWWSMHLDATCTNQWGDDLWSILSNDPVLCGVRLHLLLLVSSWLQTDITVNCSRQSFNIIQSQSKPFWLQISWCFSIPMSGSPDSSSDFLIPEERSFRLPEEPLPPHEEGCFPEEPLPEERFLLPEEPLPPPVQPVENNPLRVQPELPLTNLPPLEIQSGRHWIPIQIVMQKPVTALWYSALIRTSLSAWPGSIIKVIGDVWWPSMFKRSQWTWICMRLWIGWNIEVPVPFPGMLCGRTDVDLASQCQWREIALYAYWQTWLDRNPWFCVGQMWLAVAGIVGFSHLHGRPELNTWPIVDLAQPGWLRSLCLWCMVFMPMGLEFLAVCHAVKYAADSRL